MLFLTKKVNKLEYINFDNKVFKRTEYEGYYVCKEGFIVSVKVKGGQGKLDFSNPRYHNYRVDQDGYLEVCLSFTKDKVVKRKYKRLHRLVWETFNGPILNGLTIDHIDCNRQNNNLSNLQLLTRSLNTRKANQMRKGESRSLMKGQSVYKLTINNETIYPVRHKDLIKKYGISDWHICQIKKGNYPNTLKEKGILLERV